MVRRLGRLGGVVSRAEGTLMTLFRRKPPEPTRKEQVRLVWLPIVRQLTDEQRCILSSDVEARLLDEIDNAIAFGTPSPLIIEGSRDRLIKTLVDPGRWVKCVVKI